MTPKEEALELTEKMAIHHWTDVCDYESAKQCALVAVDRILKVAFYTNNNLYEHYMQVKQEIEKL